MAGAPRPLLRLWRGSARGVRLALCVWLAVLAGGPASAQVLDAARGFEDGCDRPPGPPQSPVAEAAGGPVVSARYFGATTAYGHGVLGDAIEGSGILVRYDNGERVVCDTVEAGAERVFEDVMPRLVDLTGDGQAEVIAVAAHQRFGARIEVYGYPALGQDFQLLTHTPYIGTRFRWRGVVGAADLDGDGFVEIAEIDRPHLAKTLRIWRFDGQGLTEVATEPWLTNHRIGEPFITGGIRHCNGVAEIIVADASWSNVMAARFDGNAVTLKALGRFSQAAVERALNCR